eukprot:scaffold27367_cov112-Isochrysis_galbana.AAC.7
MQLADTHAQSAAARQRRQHGPADVGAPWAPARCAARLMTSKTEPRHATVGERLYIVHAAGASIRAYAYVTTWAL